MDELTTKFEVKTSRNDLPVPVINGIHLHSIYNPQKEAEAFTEKNIETINSNVNFLVLGLGFAYHVEEIIKASKNNNINIIVVEPNQELVNSFFQNRQFSTPNIKIKSYQKVEDYFFDYEFVHFLMKRPSILKHDTSFNLDREFYTKLLSYHSKNSVKSFFHALDKDWQNYFSDKDLSKSLEEQANILKKKPSLSNQNDFLVLALQEIKNNRTL